MQAALEQRRAARERLLAQLLASCMPGIEPRSHTVEGFERRREEGEAPLGLVLDAGVVLEDGPGLFGAAGAEMPSERAAG